MVFIAFVIERGVLAEYYKGFNLEDTCDVYGAIK